MIDYTHWTHLQALVQVVDRPHQALADGQLHCDGPPAGKAERGRELINGLSMMSTGLWRELEHKACKPWQEGYNEHFILEWSLKDRPGRSGIESRQGTV
jgi:hypothetical protein